MANISPGVYTKITDLSTYVSEVPGTIGFIAALTEKGRDNELVFLGSRSELISEFGEPNISLYGKNFGQGLYCAYNYLGEAGSLYFMRVLPSDATYSNLRLLADYEASDSTATITFDYVSSLNTKNEIKTNLEASGTSVIGIFYPIGRGVYYNGLAIRLTKHANPVLSGIYILDVYEKQSDGSDVIIESFEVSFDPKATDLNGDSLWISYVLETYSDVLRFDMVTSSGDYTSGYDLIVKTYDKEIGTVSVNLTNGSASITDNKQNFSDWSYVSGTTYNYLVIAKDSRGTTIWGWLGTASGPGYETCTIHDDRIVATSSQKWNGDVASFDTNGPITYEVKKAFGEIENAFVSAEPAPLKEGSDGSLISSGGTLNTTVATEILSQAYAGTIDDKVLDTENIYFSIVFDCGYPTSVKQSVSTLAQTRRDCVAILDNGDNATFEASIAKRTSDHTFNTYFCALYEEYNKIYDTFTGQDIWVSPVYHMSYILPRNDRVSEIWYAAAGFNRAAIDTIKELRFNPKLGQRDQMYLKQINPIVKFAQGYTPWGQLTTQSKPSAMQDLNVVRLVLYVKRALEQYCRNYVFEMNDSITWNAVKVDVTNFLEDVRQKRGLYSYSVEVGASDYEKKRKTFHVNVILEPTRVSEKIELNFFIK